MPSDFAALSFAVRKHRQLPAPKRHPETFVQRLIELVSGQGYDFLIPAGDNGLAAMAMHYDQLITHVPLGCPRPAIVERVLNKDQTLQAARQLGMPVPQSYLIQTSADIEPLRGELTFPAVAKPRGKYISGSYKARRFETFDELELNLRKANLEAGMLIQAYCPGYGIGIETLMNNGEPVALFQHRRLKELPAAGGVSVLAISERVDSKFAHSAIDLLRAIDWEGPAMVEFRYDPHSGTPVLMEINGRYWGSLPLTCQAGVDIPYYHWQLAHGENPQPPANYVVDLRSRWFAGDFKRLQGVLSQSRRDKTCRHAARREVLRFLVDSRPAIKGMTWSIWDPLPAIGEVASVLSRSLVNLNKSLLRRLLPRRLVVDLTRARLLGFSQGCMYLKLMARRPVFFGGRRGCNIPEGVRKVLVVCHGNIIRSPVAAALLAQKTKLAVRSAGLNAKLCRAADARAIRIAREIGLSLETHISTPLSKAMVDESDLIVVMDRLNETRLLNRYPHIANKVILLGAFAQTRLCDDEIPDPYIGTEEDVRGCLRTIETCTSQLAQRLEFTACASPAVTANKR